MIESCPTHVLVMSHVRMSHVLQMVLITSHVTHTNLWFLLYGVVLSHRWPGHVSHMNESCLTDGFNTKSYHTYEWVMSHKVSHMNESCLTHGVDTETYHTYEQVMFTNLMSHIWLNVSQMVFIPPFDHPLVIAGQGTIGMYTYVYIYEYVYLYIHTYIYIYIHIYIYTYIYTYIHIYIRIYIDIYQNMYIYIYIYIYRCVCVNIYIYVDIWLHVYICTYICICVCVFTYFSLSPVRSPLACMSVYICIYIWILICIHFKYMYNQKYK